MNRLPELPTATLSGPSSWVDVATPPGAVSPALPPGQPAAVYTSSAVIDLPHCVPVVPASSWTRLLPESAMYRLPALAPAPKATPDGSYSSDEVPTVASVPSPQ